MTAGLRLPAALLLALSQSGVAQVVGPKTAEGCINVADPQGRVTVSGPLTVSVFSDPYGSERVYLVRLLQAICVDDGGEFADPKVQFDRVQVGDATALLDEVLRASVGREVTISGIAFAANTRHHHVPVVVSADHVGFKGAAHMLYEEVMRLNAACVAVGGGVSGSPDCDTAIVKEEQLEKLGYCIDYPHDERLAKCSEIRWRP